MIIRFPSAERPERLAKAFRRALVAEGHDISYCRVREATAQAFGYRSWNDLLAQVGQGPAFTPDEDLDPTVRTLRQREIGSGLARALGLPPETGHALVQAVAPTRRRQRHTPFDLDAALRRVAARITRDALRITPIRHGDDSGFCVDYDLERIGFTQRFHRIVPHSLMLLVGPDGRVTTGAAHHAHTPRPAIDIPPHDTRLAWLLNDADLTNPDPTPQAGDPLVLETLMRLDKGAITRLRRAPRFTHRAYDVLRTLPEAHPINGFLDAYPLIAVDVADTLDGTGLDPIPGVHAGPLVGSSDPHGWYLDWQVHAANEAPRGWALSREALAQAFEAIAVHDDPACPPFHCWLIEMIACAPAGTLPRGPAQVQAALRLAETFRFVLEPTWSITPDRLFQNFQGDWIDLERRLRGEITGLNALDLKHGHNDVALILVNAALAEQGRPIAIGGAQIRHMPLAKQLRDRISGDDDLPHIFARRRDWRIRVAQDTRDDLLRVIEGGRAITAPLHWIGLARDLAASTYLPVALRASSATQILSRLDVDVDALLAGLENTAQAAA
jgi:hypothetical protein